jgi:hypothetical protein
VVCKAFVLLVPLSLICSEPGVMLYFISAAAVWFFGLKERNRKMENTKTFLDLIGIQKYRLFCPHQLISFPILSLV